MPGTSGTTTGIGNMLPSSLYPSLVQRRLLPRYHEISPLPALCKKLPRIVGNDIVYGQISKSTINSTTTDVWNGEVPIQAVSASSTTIPIKKVQTWGYSMPPLLEAQTPLRLMTAQLNDNAEELSDEISKQVFADMFSGAGNQMGTIDINIETAYFNLIDMNNTLNKLNVPKNGRRFLIDYDYLTLLQKSRGDGAYDIDPNGRVHGLKIGPYEVYATNLLTSTPGTTESNGTTTNPTGQALLIQEDAYGYLEQLGKIQYIDGSTGNMSETFQGALLWGSGYLLPKNVVACTCSYTLGLPANTEVSFDI